MNVEDLREIQLRWLNEEGLDASSALDWHDRGLPDGEESWDAWTRLRPPDIDGMDDDAAAESVDRWRLQVASRTTLVRHARALIAWEQSTRDLDETAERIRQLPIEHERHVEEWSSRRRASDAMDAISRLTSEQRRRAARITYRCPRGCLLVQVFDRRQVCDGRFAESLLIIGYDERRNLESAWLVGDPSATAGPMTISIGCKHGIGQFPTVLSDELERFRRGRRIVTQVPGTKWTPR